MTSKQKVLLGLAGLTALAVGAGSVGTMAWFYSNTTVTASGLSMSVSAPLDRLQIADIAHSATAKDSDWKSSLNFNASNVVLSPVMICAGPTTDLSDVKFYVPNSSNPVLSNGQIEHSNLAESTYFTESDSSAYFSKEFRIKWLDRNESLNESPFFDICVKCSNSNICSCLRYVFYLDNSNSHVMFQVGDDHWGEEDYSQSYSGADFYISSAAYGSSYGPDGGCFYGSNNVMKITMFVYLDGNDPGCLTANVDTSTYALSMTISVASRSFSYD